ncbi:hypothetical protein HKX48_007037, partial [Thoreauomyces humboldtii]
MLATVCRSAALRRVSSSCHTSTIPRPATTPLVRAMSSAVAANPTTVVKGHNTVVPQSPNRTTVWSEHQQKKQVAMSGARFEQTDFELQ